MPSNFHPALQQLIAQNSSLRASLAHHGNAVDAVIVPGVATSFAALDQYLPWHGLPTGAMTEIMTDTVGCGELSLLLPAMARLSQERRPILCIGVPHKLFAPALRQAGVDVSRISQINPSPRSQQFNDNLWSAEQALKTGLPAMVLLWSPPRSNGAIETLRRLHLACLGRETLLVHFRDISCSGQPSPAWLRLSYTVTPTQARLQVLKCRSQPLVRPLIVLERAALQARLFEHLHALNTLSLAVATGQINQVAPLQAHTSNRLQQSRNAHSEPLQPLIH
jgi:hypothetical protein